MRRFLVTALLTLILSGCVAQTAIPPFVVMLTVRYPRLDGRCTGVALDATHVLTANHCVDLPRVVTQTGQEAGVVLSQQWPDSDMAVLESDEPLIMTEYAQFAAPMAGIPAFVWAACPYYWPQTVRVAYLAGAVALTIGELTYQFDRWTTATMMGDSQKICGGDSGAALVQGDNVVGIISAVDSPAPWLPIGETFYTVGGVRVAEMVGDGSLND